VIREGRRLTDAHEECLEVLTRQENGMILKIYARFFTNDTDKSLKLLEVLLAARGASS
jgi:hypothetical protein